ncbi:MAG: hypothetical protein R3C19_02765 [Planctomycetaceae bacterium]
MSPRDITSFSALAFDSNGGTTIGTIQAFDANDFLLGTSTGPTPGGGGGMLLELAAPNIAYVVMSMDADGGSFDTVTFTPVPEPNAAALAGLAVVFLLGRRQMARPQKQSAQNK